MTILLKDLDSISNYFNQLEDGIGLRGSSFTDVDAVDAVRQTRIRALTHDGCGGNRFLFREFKSRFEEWNRGQLWGLEALSQESPNISVWLVQLTDIEGDLDFCECPSRRFERISEETYRCRYGNWWAKKPIREGEAPSRLHDAIIQRWGVDMPMDRALAALADLIQSQAPLTPEQRESQARKWFSIVDDSSMRSATKTA